MKPPFTASHDANGDTLYVTGSDNREAVGIEIAPGVLVRFAKDNGALVGVTVMDVTTLRRDDWINVRG